MAYVDWDYYNNVFQGETVAEADFPALLRRAECIVEEMTMYRASPLTFTAMPDAIQERVKNAVCAQVEYLDANGGSDLDNDPAGLQSASLGKYSYTKAAGGAGGGTSQSIYAPQALRYLAPTGLLYRGDGCY